VWTKTVPEPLRPAPAGRVVFFNNIVTPYTNRLFNGAVAAGVDLTVVSAAATEPNRSWGALAAQDYEHIVLPGRRVRLGAGRFAYFNSGIFRTLNRLKPRLLVINGFFPSMLIAVLWAMLTRTRLMLSIDGWAETMPNSIYHRLVRPFVLRRCRGVICPGLKGRDYFLAQGVAAANIHIVPLVPAWDPPATAPGFAERPFDLLWCAHLNDDVKNAKFLVEVCRLLAPKFPALRVRVVGTGPAENATLQQLGGIGVAVTHDPSFEWHRMAEVFTAAKLLVFPSLWEPWGLVCNEALQCGTPALVSPHVGAGDDLVRSGQTGAVVPLEADVWADRIATLLREPARWNDLSSAGRDEMHRRTLAASVTAFADAVAAGLR
jgi:glycosyltransferase involved in cell wall biosynthesis